MVVELDDETLQDLALVLGVGLYELVRPSASSGGRMISNESVVAIGKLIREIKANE